MQLKTLVSAIWGGSYPEKSLLTLWAGHGKEAVVNVKHVWFDRFDHMDLSFVAEWNRTANVFFGLGSRKLTVSPRKTGGNSFVNFMPGWAIDFDFRDPTAHKAQNYPGDFDEIVPVLQEFLLPTAIVRSGHGIHGYWGLDQALSISPGREFDQALNWYTQLFDRLKKAFAKRGWQLDSTAGIWRSWRAPGTVNHKTGALAEIEYSDGDRYRISDFGFGKTVLKPVSAKTPVPPDILKSVRTFLRAVSATDKDYEKIQALLRGESFAPPGEREPTMRNLAHAITRAEGGKDARPEDMAEVFRGSFQAWQDEPQAPGESRLTVAEEIAKVTKKIRSSQEKRNADDEAEAEHYSGIKRGLLSKRPPTLAELQQMLILVKSPSYYVYNFKKRDYGFPVAKDELQVHCAAAWRGAPASVSISYENDKGKTVYKMSPQLVREYGTVVKGLLGDLSIQQSFYDRDENIFHPALCPRRKLESKFHEEIDEWLRIFAGEFYVKLKDWLAAFSRVESPTCVLYLEGDTNTGKSLIARGLARVYVKGDPADFDTCVGTTFNDQLRHCPYALLEEGVSDNRNMSSKIRSLSTSNGFVLNAKYHAAVPIRGCVRIVVTANNPDALRFSESNSKRDLDAIASRILHIPVRPESTEWLKERGGRNFVESWVEGDRMAEHILWLEQNHKFVPGRRLLVEGIPTVFHGSLRCQSEADNLLYEFLVRFLSNLRLALNLERQGKDVGFFIDKKGRLLVSSQGVLDYWETYLSDRQKPVSGQSVGHGLHKISLGKVKVLRFKVRRHYHVIDTQFLIAWAEKNMIGDLDAILENLKPQSEFVQ